MRLEYPEYPGTIYHVTARENERRAIYRDAGDYAHCLSKKGGDKFAIEKLVPSDCRGGSVPRADNRRQKAFGSQGGVSVMIIDGVIALNNHLMPDPKGEEKHKEWLEPHPKGFIPELSDADDLMLIEQELARKDLNPSKKAGLEELQVKAMTGKLREGELAKWRRQGGSASASIKTFLSKLRTLRRSGAKLADMPAEAITHLDDAIGVIDRQEAKFFLQGQEKCHPAAG